MSSAGQVENRPPFEEERIDEPVRIPPRALSREVAPVQTNERIASIDLLRGVALCGILVVNVLSFGWPLESYLNPTLAGGFSGVDRLAWYVTHIFFELKMVTLFSMLFGAGLILQTGRAEERGARPGWLYYRRVLLLMAFGMAHAILVWEGDILFQYGACGLVLFLFRRRSPRTLIVLGLAAILVYVPLSVGLGALLNRSRAAVGRVAEAEGRGEAPAPADKAWAKAWVGMGPYFAPNAEELSKSIQTMRGSYGEILRERAPEMAVGLPFLVLFYGWRVGGVMLLGMALMKLGVFSGERSRRFYGRLAAIGLGAGLPLVTFGALKLERSAFDVAYVLGTGGLYNYFGSLLVAMGYVGLIMLACQKGRASRVTTLLANTGRMALTNYLVQSILCTSIFYGYGLGLFGSLSRAQLLLVVAGVLAFQLVYSTLWLQRFRFGPAEWLWRSLTYLKRQPIRH